MTEKSVLVTGASGFVGNVLCHRLQCKSYKVRAMLHNIVTGPWNEALVVDLLSDLPPAALMNVDTVFHLAGIAHDFKTGSNMDRSYRKINTEATIRLALLAADNDVKRFVFVSSVKAGGTSPEGTCADEENPGPPDGIYGKTKRDAEIELLRIGKKTGMHVSIIRPALVYGPGLKGNLKLMINGIKKGWFPPLPEKGNIRTMVHLDDMVEAVILAAEKDEARGEIFIVTDGKQYSSREIYNEMCVALGKKIPNWSVPESIFFMLAKLGDLLGKFIKVPFDSHRYSKLLGDDCYSSAKIRTKLGFQPHNTLKDALPEIVAKMNK